MLVLLAGFCPSIQTLVNGAMGMRFRDLNEVVCCFKGLIMAHGWISLRIARHQQAIQLTAVNCHPISTRMFAQQVTSKPLMIRVALVPAVCMPMEALPSCLIVSVVRTMRIRFQRCSFDIADYISAKLSKKMLSEDRMVLSRDPSCLTVSDHNYVSHRTSGLSCNCLT